MSFFLLDTKTMHKNEMKERMCVLVLTTVNTDIDTQMKDVKQP